MAALRLILLVFGLLLLAGVFLYSRGWLPQAYRKLQSVIARREQGRPENDGVQAPPAEIKVLKPELPGGNLTLDEQSKIIAIRLMPKRSKGFAGKDLLPALRNAGLKFGRFNVFHRPDRHNPGQSLFSVASLIDPGSFDLAQINDTKVPGISVFIVLPSPEDSLMAFDNMLSTARELAQVLDADLFDERGSTLSVQRERYLREELIEYQHRQSRASALCG